MTAHQKSRFAVSLIPTDPSPPSPPHEVDVPSRHRVRLRIPPFQSFFDIVICRRSILPEGGHRSNSRERVAMSFVNQCTIDVFVRAKMVSSVADQTEGFFYTATDSQLFVCAYSLPSRSVHFAAGPRPIQ